MVIAWRIDEPRRLVLLRYGGSPEFTFWADTMRAIFAHPAYRPGFGFVAELDASVPPDTPHLMQVMEFVAEHAADFAAARWANVTSNPAHYGMTRVVQARTQHLPSTVGVFATVEEAIAWASPELSDEL